jgi:hypothetical protein
MKFVTSNHPERDLNLTNKTTVFILGFAQQERMVANLKQMMLVQ